MNYNIIIENNKKLITILIIQIILAIFQLLYIFIYKKIFFKVIIA